MLVKRWGTIGQEMNRLQSELDQLFGRWGWDGPRMARTPFPLLNIWQDENAVHVEAELPGLDVEKLEVTVSGGNQLSLQGERKAPELEGGGWHRQERSFGSFHRQVELPHDVDADAVTAEFKLGVLHVVLPKRPEMRPRKIEVSAG